MPDKFFFEDILREAKKIGIPITKKRAIIREFLQCKFLHLLYSQKKSEKLSLIGGTGLRLIRGLDRFSEDMDFDNLGLSFREIKQLFLNCANKMNKEGFDIEFNLRKTDKSGIGRLRFINLLQKMEISVHPKEKLMIKLDYTTPSIKPGQEIITLSRFGFVQNIVTARLESILVQKARALLTRKAPQARDFYDIVWLLSHHVKPDAKLFKTLQIENETQFWQRLLNHYQKIKPRLKIYKQKLMPFLINPENIKYLDLFGDLIKTKMK